MQKYTTHNVIYAPWIVHLFTLGVQYATELPIIMDVYI